MFSKDGQELFRKKANKVDNFRGKFVVALGIFTLGVAVLAPSLPANSAERDIRADLPSRHGQFSSSWRDQLPRYLDAARTSCGCNDGDLLTISPTATPTISGTATVKKTLTARTTGWMAGLTFSYQWLRNGADIPAATLATYKLVKADAKKRISVRVRATHSGYAPKSLTSGLTRAVKP